MKDWLTRNYKLLVGVVIVGLYGNIAWDFYETYRDGDLTK